NSIILVPTVWANSKSWVVKRMVPLKFLRELLKAVIDSKSKWFVGSSNIKTLARIIIIRLNIHLTFSPPDRTLLFFKAASPPKTHGYEPLHVLLRFWHIDEANQLMKDHFQKKPHYPEVNNFEW